MASSSGGRVPNGGYGWVIVAASCVVHALSAGTIFSISVLYVPWLEEFKASKSETSWVVSTGSAFLYGSGPLAAFLSARFSYRFVCILGSVVASVGFGLSCFANSVTMLILTVGVIGGLGVGCCFLTAVTIVAIYFDTKRPIAYGIACAGVGVGALVQAPIINYLEQEYGWRGTMLLISGNLLHMAVCGLLLRPLNLHSKDLDGRKEKSHEDVVHIVGNDSGSQHFGLLGVSRIRDDDSLQIVSIQEADCQGHFEEVASNDLQISDFGSTPSQETQYLGSHTIHPNHERVSNSGLNAFVNNSTELNGIHNNDNLNSKDIRCYLLQRQLFPEISRSVQHLRPSESDFCRKCSSARELRPADSVTLESTGSVKKRGVWKKIDILLTGSIHSLAVSGHKDGQLSVKLLDNDEDMDAEDGPDNSPNSEQKKRRLASFSQACLDALAILKDRTCLAVALSNFLTNLSFLMPLVYMVDRALEEGIDRNTGALFVSINGIGSIFGRLFFAFLANIQRVDTVLLYVAILVMAGVAVGISPTFANIVPLHAIYSFIFGALTGGWSSVLTQLVVELMGIEKIAQSYGITCFFSGVANAMGPPIAGLVYAWTGGFTWSFILHGIFLVASTVPLIPFSVQRLDLCNRRKDPQLQT